MSKSQYKWRSKNTSWTLSSHIASQHGFLRNKTTRSDRWFWSHRFPASNWNVRSLHCTCHQGKGTGNWRTKILNFLEIGIGVWCFLSLITRICTEVLCEDCSGPWFRDHKYDKRFTSIHRYSRKVVAADHLEAVDSVTGLRASAKTPQGRTSTSRASKSWRIAMDCHATNQSTNPKKSRTSLFRTFSPEVNKAIPTLDQPR